MAEVNPLGILENTPTPAFLVGGGGMILWANRAAQLLCPKLTEDKNFESCFGPGSFSCLTDPTRRATLSLSDRPNLTVMVQTLSPNQLSEPRWLCSLEPRRQERSQSPLEFIATVAHDLKNPLSAVFGYSDTLLDTDLGLGLSVRHREIIDRIRGTAARTIEFIRNLQFLYRLEHNPKLRSEAASDLSVVVKSVVESMWRPQEEKRTLLLHLPSSSVRVLLNKIELERIVSNLLSNALKFAPVDGTIEITVFEQPNNGATALTALSVRNSGSYIPPEERSMLFKHNFRGANASAFPGAGLGLAIVHQITQLSGGSVSVESDPKTGTTFTALLPRAS